MRHENNCPVFSSMAFNSTVANDEAHHMEYSEGWQPFFADRYTHEPIGRHPLMHISTNEIQIFGGATADHLHNTPTIPSIAFGFTVHLINNKFMSGRAGSRRSHLLFHVNDFASDLLFRAGSPRDTIVSILTSETQSTIFHWQMETIDYTSKSLQALWMRHTQTQFICISNGVFSVISTTHETTTQ